MSETLSIAQNWRETTFGEVADIFTGKKDVNETTPNGKYIFFSCSPDSFKSDEYIRDDKAIIIAGNGSYTGAVRFFEGKFDLYQRTYGCVLKKEHRDDFDIKFLFYYLKKYFERDFMGGSRGSSIPYIVRGDIENFEIPNPPITEQKEIAGVLSSLDDKMELLRKQNETLEQIAQAIFHEWFVEFNFPNENGKPYKVSGGKMIKSELGEIPEGWRVDSLSKIAVFLNGLALQKFPPESATEYLPVIKIRELSAGISVQTDKASARLDKKYIVENGDVLFSWSGSLIVDIWKYGKGALNQHLFRVTSENFPKWFYYHWIKEHLTSFQQTATAKAVTMGHIQRHHLDDALVVIPNETVLKVADEVFAPMLEKFINNNSQIQTLSALRDSLLPKLMSGEIGVILK